MNDRELLQRLFDLERKCDHLTHARLNRWYALHLEYAEDEHRQLPYLDEVELDLSELRRSAHATEVSLRSIQSKIERRGGLAALYHRLAEAEQKKESTHACNTQETT